MANLSRLHLPACSPELNVMENVYNLLKSSYHANRVFETVEETRANVLAAWQDFISSPERMTSVMHQNGRWLRLAETSHRLS